MILTKISKYLGRAGILSARFLLVQRGILCFIG